MLYLWQQSSHLSLLAVDSHFSMQVLCTRASEPAHLHGEMSLSLDSVSWQIRQNNPDEFFEQFASEELAQDISLDFLTKWSKLFSLLTFILTGTILSYRENSQHQVI